MLLSFSSAVEEEEDDAGMHACMPEVRERHDDAIATRISEALPFQFFKILLIPQFFNSILPIDCEVWQ